jgi:hypothetical protein
MDGYVPVSRRTGRDGPGTVQREAIQRWADYRGAEIVAWHVARDGDRADAIRCGVAS